jgi:hypothetical protein
MGLGSFIWYGGGAGVAVLYSVVVGAVREFWVKTAKYDVKVGEIPTEEEIPWEPYDLPNGTTTYVPGAGAADTRWTWSLTGLLNANLTVEMDIYEKTFSEWVIGTTETCRFLGTEYVNVTGSGTQTFANGVYNVETGTGGRPGPLMTVNRTLNKGSDNCGPATHTSTRGRYTTISNGVVANPPGSYFGAPTQIYDEDDVDIDRSGEPIIYGRNLFDLWIDSAGPIHRPTTAVVKETYNYNVTLNSSVSTPGGTVTPPDWPTGDPPPPPPDPLFAPVPYESFISALKPKIFALIKSNVDEDDEEFGELAYKKLIGETVLDLGTTADPDDWRGLAVSLTPTAEITSSDSCLEDYLDIDDGALIDGNLYRIDIDQYVADYDGFLRTLLETSPDTVAATLTTQTATSGETCTLGTATTSTVQVPSPGRGTIEGITYLP